MQCKCLNTTLEQIHHKAIKRFMNIVLINWNLKLPWSQWTERVKSNIDVWNIKLKRKL